MKLQGQHNLLCAIAFFTLAASVTASPDAATIPTAVAIADVKGSNQAGPIGTEHAPIDGKDGIPKSGPWVETGADRERKKSAGSTDETHDYKKEVTDPTRQKLPQSNEGVMDDKSRTGPVDGTRGTEGGISKKEKGKDIIDTDPKRPDPPKEQPPIPHSELEKIPVAGGDIAKDVKTTIEDGINKITDKTKEASEKINNNLPYTDGSPSTDKTIPLDDPRLQTHPSAGRPDTSIPAAREDIVQPIHSMFLSFTMILFSEIGDKTFLVACLMAMRHDRLLVFSAAYAALVTMTVLSAVLGHAVPTLIPKWLTNFLAAGLFLVFGVKMLLEARAISPDEGVSEEMKEVEQELEEKEHEALRRSRRRSSISPHVLESGRGGIRKGRSDGRLPSPPDSPISGTSSRSGSPSRSTLSSITGGINNLFSLLLSPAWVQTFVMTFLGEWGDRSQIATIAMAAGSDYWWVTAGALGGHAICTGVAVIGGKAIAGKVSLRTGKSFRQFIRIIEPQTNSFGSYHGRCDCILGLRCCVSARSYILKARCAVLCLM